MNAKENEGSYVFLLRLWPQEANGTAHSTANGTVDTRWCGRVQHVMSGEAHNFQDWPALVDLLLTMIPVPDTAQQQETAD
jgi:hypothetical protein